VCFAVRAGPRRRRIRSAPGGRCRIQPEVFRPTTQLSLTFYLSCCIFSTDRAYDREMAFKRLESTPNVTFTTTESLLFELVRTAEHPHFRTISGLLKEHNHVNFV